MPAGSLLTLFIRCVVFKSPMHVDRIVTIETAIWVGFDADIIGIKNRFIYVYTLFLL